MKKLTWLVSCLVALGLTAPNAFTAESGKANPPQSSGKTQADVDALMKQHDQAVAQLQSTVEQNHGKAQQRGGTVKAAARAASASAKVYVSAADLKASAARIVAAAQQYQKWCNDTARTLQAWGFRDQANGLRNSGDSVLSAAQMLKRTADTAQKGQHVQATIGNIATVDVYIS